jgi:hypothetical protein
VGRVVFREAHVVSVETRRGLYVLGQMSRAPFILFFAIFRDSDEWDDVKPEELPILCCIPVTRQFLQSTRITKHRSVPPRAIQSLPRRWIHPRNHESRTVRLWPGTPHSVEMITIGEGGSLVEKDILGHRGGPYKHPSGV